MMGWRRLDYVGEKVKVGIDSMDKKLSLEVMIGIITVLYHLTISSGAG